MAAITVTDASHSSHLVEEFVSMRKAGELFDYVIKGSQESFSIHSLVLASMSPVFKAMIKSSMGESVKREAKFPTIPDGIMRKIIDFSYTGTCTFARDELMPLIKAAHFLGMSKLLKLCEDRIGNVLQPANCFSWLRIADGLELGVIMPQIEKLMYTSHKEVIQTDEFQGAEMTEIIQYLSSLRKKGVDSDTLVEAVLRWIKHDSPNRSVNMIELLECVSLGKCTKPFLSKVVKENAELLATQHNVYKLMLTEILSEDSAQPCERLLVLGGQSLSGLANNECWILEDNELVKFAQVPGTQIASLHSMCQVPQGVLLTGGDRNYMCKLFDVTSKAWLDKANLRSHRSCHGSGYLSGKVFVIGGNVQRSVTRTVDYTDLNMNTWQQGPAIPETEDYPKVAECNSMLYVLLTGKGRLYCLDGATMAWTKRSNIPRASEGCSMAAVDDKLFAAGGKNNITCVYTPVSNTWCRLTGPSLREGNGSLVSYRQKLLLIGGCAWDKQMRDVDEYDISSDTWFRAAWKLPTPLYLHGAFVFDSLK